MTATFHILTLTPTKRGRKYFTCSLPDKAYAVKLVIDSLSQDLALGMSVAIRAKDLSRHSAFGSQIIYEATQILDSHWTDVERNGASVAIIERSDGTREAILSEQIMLSDNYEEPNWSSLIHEVMAKADARKLDQDTASAKPESRRARL